MKVILGICFSVLIAAIAGFVLSIHPEYVRAHDAAHKFCVPRGETVEMVKRLGWMCVSRDGKTYTKVP